MSQNTSDLKLKQVLSGILMMPVERITDEVSLKTTEEWDSLKHMELIVAIEEEFKINLEFDDIVAMTNLPAIRKILSAKGVFS